MLHHEVWANDTRRDGERITLVWFHAAACRGQSDSLHAVGRSIVLTSARRGLKAMNKGRRVRGNMSQFPSTEQRQCWYPRSRVRQEPPKSYLDYSWVIGIAPFNHLVQSEMANVDAGTGDRSQPEQRAAPRSARV